jgi:hypothetical protein
MDAQTSTFANAARTALEIGQRMKRDLDEVRKALVGHDDAKAVRLMRKFLKVQPDASANADESEHAKQKPKPTRGGEISTEQRRAS